MGISGYRLQSPNLAHCGHRGVSFGRLGGWRMQSGEKTQNKLSEGCQPLVIGNSIVILGGYKIIQQTFLLFSRTVG
jgi:hypothetical protein